MLMSSADPAPLFVGWRAVLFTLAVKLANLHIIRKGDLQRFIKRKEKGEFKIGIKKNTGWILSL